MRGWVYVITNPAMPGLVKVGYSTKDPSIRAKELDHTGSPLPYVVEYDVIVESPYDIEQKIHIKLNKYHVGKEWFRCKPEEAVVAIHEMVKETALLENFRHVSRDNINSLQQHHLEEERIKNKNEERDRRSDRFEAELSYITNIKYR